MNLQNVYKKIAEDMNYLFANMANTLKFDKTFRAKVISKESNGKYKVLYKNKYYLAKCDGQLNIDDMVWVCAPKNDWNELYVQFGKTLQNQVNTLLPLTGGTITGAIHFNNEIFTKMSHYVHSSGGISGTDGYVGICRLTIKGNYLNQSIRLKVLQRGKDGGEISIRFNNANSKDPSLASFKVYQDLTEVRIVKVTTSTWDLYIKKSEAYDYIDIIDMQKGYYMRNVIVEWTNRFSSASPGGTVATVV